MKKLPPLRPRRSASRSEPVTRRRIVLAKLPLYEVPDENIDCQRLGMDWLWFEQSTSPHAWMNCSVEHWSEENRWLASRAGVDDEALIELLRRDPRYLGSPTVLARIFRWKLDVLRAQVHHPGGDSSDESKAANAKARTARAKLKALAQTVCFVTGRGNQQKWKLPIVRREYRSVLAAVDGVRAALSQLSAVSPSDVQQIAADWKLDGDFVVEISVNPRRREGIAYSVLGRRYGISPERMRKLLETGTQARPTEGKLQTRSGHTA